MSDQAAEQPGVEQGSLNFDASGSADAPSEPVTASTAETSAAKDAPMAEAVVSGSATPESSISEPVLSEAVTAEASKVEAVAPATEPEATTASISHTPTKVIVMPRENRAWAEHGFHAGAEAAAAHQSGFGKRRMAAIAAAVALATAAGALGGAFATATFMHGSNDVAMNGGQSSSHASLEASLSRVDAEIQALKSGLEHTSKLGMSQFNKTTDRLDKLERAQTEPAARLAKLSEAVDKPRAVPAAALVVATAAPPAASAAKETTGSIGATPAQQATTAVPKTELKTEPKTEVGRLPTVEGWVLRDVAYGSALIDSRRGTYEVYAGDMIPGLGRVDAIRRQDGRWVVVTSRGLIVAR